MTEATRTGRTERLLSGRLDELACAVERASVTVAAAARLLESASVATMHAVSLELLTSARASELWQEAAERHPQVEPLTRCAT
ncbi:MAG: hypothetical protein ABR569_06625 [Gaiellaceae bacterium]